MDDLTRSLDLTAAQRAIIIADVRNGASVRDLAEAHGVEFLPLLAFVMYRLDEADEHVSEV